MTDTFSKSERSRIMAAVKSKDTTPELIVRRLVHAIGHRFRLHVGSLPGQPDLVFQRLRKVIFVSGCFWHMHDCGRCRIPSSRRNYWVKKLRRNATRDKRVQRTLRHEGWGVMVIWECQTHSHVLNRLCLRLARFLSAPRIQRQPEQALEP
jgi:DNA mismatch endonuclease, patch repair protein